MKAIQRHQDRWQIETTCIRPLRQDDDKEANIARGRETEKDEYKRNKRIKL